jgi:hypothetical protein
MGKIANYHNLKKAELDPDGVKRVFKNAMAWLLAEGLISEAYAAGWWIRTTKLQSRKRWGFCSNWRQMISINMPGRNAACLMHEVAHVVHFNHGPEFKALEKRMFDAYKNGEIQ